MFALFCVTFYLYPFWCWYVGFRYKRARFEKYLKQGWQLVEKDRRAA
jgi:hypothetical protein